MPEPTSPPVEDAGPGRGVRVGVVAVLVALLVPGLIGFDAWPLTAWRLFSLARGNEQTHWVLDAVTSDGTATEVDLEDLPLPYRTAEWPLAALPGAGAERRDDVCGALLDAVVELRPGTVALQIVRDRQAQVRRNGEWVVEHHREAFHRCDVRYGP